MWNVGFIVVATIVAAACGFVAARRLRRRRSIACVPIEVVDDPDEEITRTISTRNRIARGSTPPPLARTASGELVVRDPAR
jgi:hypothetical protein